MGARAWLGVGVSALIVMSFYGCVGPCSDDCPSGDYSAHAADGAADHTVAQPQSGEPTCYDENGAVGLWFFTGPVAHQNRCASAQIAELGAACFGVGSAITDASTPDDADADASSAVDAGTSCKEVEALNADCATCIVGAAYDGGAYSPSPIVFPVSADSAELSVDTAGCVASLSTANAQCKQGYEELSICSNSVCSVCAPSDLQSCLTYAGDPNIGAFCEEGARVDYTCNALVTSVPLTDQQAQCGVGSSDFATAFAIVANTMCGP
jgi:hypothetical protein